jgi:serine/threonine protein kinase
VSEEASTEEWLKQHVPIESGASLADGTVVGRWRIVAFIARGGAGEVYRAIEDNGNRTAALKILHRSDTAAYARFEREVRVLSEIHSPAFPTFFESGEYEGRPWSATEFLKPLDMPTTDGAVARLVCAVCRGAGALHSLGYVHRDIKPSNILSRNGEPVLIDLGLLKQSETPEIHIGETLSVIDGHPVGVGTPGYAAPEQFTGGEISPAADIHAIGVLASECFGGHPPSAWRTIIRRATSSLPAERYPDVGSLARAVRFRNLPLAAAVAAAMTLAVLAAVAVVRGKLPQRQTAHLENSPIAVVEPLVAQQPEQQPGQLEDRQPNQQTEPPADQQTAGLEISPIFEEEPFEKLLEETQEEPTTEPPVQQDDAASLTTVVTQAQIELELPEPPVQAAQEQPAPVAHKPSPPHPVDVAEGDSNRVPEPKHENIQSRYSLGSPLPSELAVTARQRAIEASLNGNRTDYSIIQSDRLRTKLKDQAKNLPRVTEKQLGKVAQTLNSSMVSIPERDFEICKFELTQELWMPISGFNPSKAKGAKLPITNVTMGDVEEFLHDLNSLPEVRALGKPYRLPTAEEWEYACLAGGTNGFCRLADGTQITEETLGEVAWFGKNSKGKPHPVGTRKPNAFGLYDMHGNVAEFTMTAINPGSMFSSDYICKGNAYGGEELGAFRADFSPTVFSELSFYSLGFRLAR